MGKETKTVYNIFEEMKRYPTSAVSTYAPIKSNAPAPAPTRYRC